MILKCPETKKESIRSIRIEDKRENRKRKVKIGNNFKKLPTKRRINLMKSKSKNKRDNKLKRNLRKKRKNKRVERKETKSSRIRINTINLQLKTETSTSLPLTVMKKNQLLNKRQRNELMINHTIILINACFVTLLYIN